MDTSSSNDKRAQESGDVVTPSAKRQKLGERKSEVEVEGDNSYLIPLRLTARSGYLALEEVARLLLFTGKTFMGDIFGDLLNSSGEMKQSTGGAQIEDVGPFRYYHNVEVERNEQTKTFGFSLHSFSGRRMDNVGCQIKMVGALMLSSEMIEEQDGKNVEEWKWSEVVKEIRAVRGNTINLSIRRFRTDVKLQIWKCICQHKWRDSKVLGQLMTCVGNRCRNGEADWKGLFQKFCQRRSGNKNLKNMANYEFLLSVYDCIDATLDSTPVTCLLLDSRNSLSLMKAGLTGWLEFDSPVNIGTFTSLYSKQN